MSCLNIFLKCQFFALLSLQLVTMVFRMHSEVQRRCQNKRFPAVQGFTLWEMELGTDSDPIPVVGS